MYSYAKPSAKTILISMIFIILLCQCIPLGLLEHVNLSSDFIFSNEGFDIEKAAVRTRSHGLTTFLLFIAILNLILAWFDIRRSYENIKYKSSLLLDSRKKMKKRFMIYISGNNFK